MKRKENCPLCEGNGYLLIDDTRGVPLKTSRKCYLLRKKGLSYRNIGKKVGISHPQAVKFQVIKYGRSLFK